MADLGQTAEVVNEADDVHHDEDQECDKKTAAYSQSV
jgi:hypothetical protein